MLYQINWIHELIGLLLWCFFISLFIGIGFLIWGYRNGNLKAEIEDRLFEYKRLPKFLPRDAIFMDTHTHTLYSDGIMNSEQTVKWHIANGFKVMVLTDHNSGKGNPELKDLQKKYPEILLIPGFECTTQNCHLIFMGIEDYPFEVPRVATIENIKQAIDRVHSMGGLVTISHITWTQWQPGLTSGLYVHPTREGLVAAGVDGFEINNEVRWYDPESVYFVEKENQSRLADSKLFLCTGTDIHNPFEHWVAGWTELLLTKEESNNLTWETVKRVLKEGRTKIWVSHDYDESHEHKMLREKKGASVAWQSIVFYPFLVVVGGLKSLPANASRISMIVIYSIIGYIILRCVQIFILPNLF